jgi:hypothetical protein
VTLLRVRRTEPLGIPTEYPDTSNHLHRSKQVGP